MMSGNEKKSPSIFSTIQIYEKSKLLNNTGAQITNPPNENHEKTIEFLIVHTNKTLLIQSDKQELDEAWEIVGPRKLKKVRKNETNLSSLANINTHQTTNQTIQSVAVHSYFSFGRAEPNSQPRSNQTRFSQPPRTATRHLTQVPTNDNIHEREIRTHLPPFKIEFERQQKPPEIQVLNDLVKFNNRLNVNAASYSKNTQSQHILLLFINDSSTNESLFQTSSWPNAIFMKEDVRSSQIPTQLSSLERIHFIYNCNEDYAIEAINIRHINNKITMQRVLDTVCKSTRHGESESYIIN